MTGIDRLDLRCQQLCEMARIARRGGGADPDRLVVTIDPVEMAIEPARALADPHKLSGEIVSKVVDDLGKGLGGDQRLHESASAPRLRLGKDRLDRFGCAAKRLIEAAMERAAEPLRQGRAGCADQLFDPLEPELAQPIDDARFEPERGDRQQCQCLAMIAGLDRHRPPGGDMPRDGMRAPGGVGDGDLHGQPERGETAVQILDQRALRVEQGGAAGDVEPQAVRRIGRDDRRVTLAGPECEASQPLQVGLRIGIDHVEPIGERPRLGNGHSRPDAERAGTGIHRRDDAPAMIGDGGDERRYRVDATVRRRLGRLPPHPVGRPVR